MNQFQFNIQEVLSLLGVFQCVYILVYIVFRAPNIITVFLPCLYFLVLGAAFFSDLSERYIGQAIPYYSIINWMLWSYGPPISALLIIQMAQSRNFPKLMEWGVLLFVPLALLVSVIITKSTSTEHCEYINKCSEFGDWLNITGMIAGALSLLMIWFQRDLFALLSTQKSGSERYWVILALVFVNIFLLTTYILALGREEYLENAVLLRNILGLSFIYLVNTSLLRIYPQTLILKNAKPQQDDVLSEKELQVAAKIENLLALDKIYHETSYSRSDLAKELDLSESVISRIINIYFQKSFPTILNERRVEDAKRMLLETDVGIKIISEEVGFNSLASFNRVFKEIEGRSPRDYRKNMIG
ncbi:MAG: helix-turn-helix domain-containing protein [Alphaproteobacteria bacterium]|nr:helix-turn-helix domain-containing protein [Alphaproteobacteria bacterium]